jgi:hypothetical protein
MNFLFSFLLSTSAYAWESGQAPFCVMDNYGNLECYYYDLQSCRVALKQKYGAASCVKK